MKKGKDATKDSYRAAFKEQETPLRLSRSPISFSFFVTLSLYRLLGQLSTIACKLDVGSEERRNIDDTMKQLRAAANVVRVLECTFDDRQPTEFDVNNVAEVIPAYDAEVRLPMRPGKEPLSLQDMSLLFGEEYSATYDRKRTDIDFEMAKLVHESALLLLLSLPN